MEIIRLLLYFCKTIMGKFEEIANGLVMYRIKTSWLLIEKFYNDEANKNDVSMSMAFVLLAINSDKGSTVTSIAPRIGMEPNSISRTLNAMVEKGYVIKKKSKSDKRKVYICLTALGLEKQRLALEKMFDMENNINKTMSAEDLKGFFNVVENLSANLAKLKK